MTQKLNTRPRGHLDQVARDYPGVWATLDVFREDKEGLGGWADWCFLPLAASYAVVSQGGHMPPDKVGDVGRLGALYAWRYTQGIYRIDPSLLDDIGSTPITGDLPSDVLMQLPEWCIYIETPGLTWIGQPMHGFFVHLEHDAEDRRAELRFLIDLDDWLLPMPLHLGAWPLAEGIKRMLQESARHGDVRQQDLHAIQDLMRDSFSRAVNLVLFVVSQAGEIKSASGQRPGNPLPEKTKRGMRLFAADKPSVWDVGTRMGTALRAAYQAEQTGQHGAHTGPRPHVRRAHWHGFWSGPRSPERASERRYDLRWLPPIPVNLERVEDLPAVIREVQK